MEILKAFYYKKKNYLNVLKSSNPLTLARVTNKYYKYVTAIIIILYIICAVLTFKYSLITLNIPDVRDFFNSKDIRTYRYDTDTLANK